MRETSTQEISTLAADEALEYVREVETLEAEIEDLHRSDREDPLVRRRLGYLHHRLGVALKLAGVHSHLAIAEQIVGIRADLPAASAIGRFTPGNVHHCSPYCPRPCPNAVE